MEKKENPWAFFQLPPFFTEQPAPGTLERQLEIWHSLLLDHAIYHSSRSPTNICTCLRHYDENSDIFYNPKLQRRMSPENARTVLRSFAAKHPNRVVKVISHSAGGKNEVEEVLVATHKEGLRAVEDGLLKSILENAGTTTAMLSQKGAVCTFEEMSQERVLSSQCPSKEQKWLAERTSNEDPLPCGSASRGGLPEDQAVRLLLKSQPYRSVAGSPFQSFAVTFFNMDGSDDEPYQGVKIGGR